MAVSVPGGNFDDLAQGGRPSLLGDAWRFMRENKKWWLLPIVLVFLFAGALVLLSGSAIAPFIYPVF